MKNLSLMFAALVAVSGAALARGKAPRCPEPVKATVAKDFPGGTIASCKAETEHGKPQFEVKLTTQDARKLELDVSPTGELLQTEETVKLDSVPEPVMKAFASKYPKAKATAAEKQTHGDGKVSYEVAFRDGKRRQEATFTADGTFVEVE